MSQHNIVGSEVFGRRPIVYLRGMKSGNFRRRKARTVMITVMVATLAAALGAAVAVAALDPAVAAAAI